MMVLDVVEVVRVPRVPHQRIEDIRKDFVHEGILLVQNSPNVNMLMLEQCVRSRIPTLHYAMEDRVPPVEVVEQIDGRR
jgi:hypothetical protein